MDIQAFRDKVLNYCKIVDKNQRALAQELSFHPTALSNKLNENDGRKLTTSEIKAIIKTLIKWEAVTEVAEILELLALKDLKPLIFTKEELSSYPLNNFKFEPNLTDGSGIKIYKQPPNNLPAQTTSLIGREDDVRTARSILGGKNTRLLTLTGPGGTGKTRLALELARAMLDDFEDGVFFVELAAVTNPNLVPNAIAQALEVEETKGNSLLEKLKKRLGDKQLLLVLDNFEQVQGASNFVGDLLKIAPKLKIMVTGREVLHIYEERRIIVPALALPDVAHLPAFDTLPKFAAIELFIDRAQAVRSDFTPDQDNLAVISEICFLLDGLPLAIELVAARSNIFTPQALLSRLKRQLFKFTSRMAVNVPERHQSLQNAIDWSFDLLNQAERELIFRLSVFPSNASLENIAAICNVDGDLPLDIFDLLNSLVNKSILNIASDHTGEPLFGMLSTVREYAFEKLVTAGLHEVITRQFAVYFRTLSEEAFQHLNTPEQEEWYDRLSNDHLNLGMAIKYSLNRNEIETALRLGAALGRYWQTRGHLSEGAYWLTQILEQSSDNPNRPIEFRLIKARAKNMLAYLKLYQGELDISQKEYEECFTVFQEFGDLLGISACYKGFGNIEYYHNNLAAALDYFEKGLEIIIELGNKKEIGDYLNNMAVIATNMGDFTRARELNERSLALRREIGDKQYTADSLNNIGLLLLWGSKFERAVPYLEEGLSIRREIGYRQGIAESLDNVAEVNYFLGKLSKAAEISKDALILHQELGDKIYRGLCLGFLACISEELGNFEEALNYCRDSLLIRMEIKDKHGIIRAIEDFGYIAISQNDFAKAVTLLGFTEFYRKEIGFNRREIDIPKHDRKVNNIRVALSASKFIQLWEEAAYLKVEDIIEMVLG